jgi:hypothetical protein
MNNKGKKSLSKEQRKPKKKKLSLFTDVIVFYLKDPKHFNKKLLDIVNSFRNVVGYKINL